MVAVPQKSPLSKSGKTTVTRIVTSGGTSAGGSVPFHEHAAAQVTSGNLSQARLPTNLQAQAIEVDNLDNATSSGWYSAGSGALNTPAASSWVVHTVQFTFSVFGTFAVQTAYEVATPFRAFRRTSSPVWSAWTLVTPNSEYSTTTPATPSTGATTFTRGRSRRVPAYVDRDGFDSQLQPAFFSNQVKFFANQHGTATPLTAGISPTAIAAATLGAMATTNFRTRTPRINYAVSSTVVNSSGGWRGPAAMYYLSSTANAGGFYMNWRFGIAASSSTTRILIGLTSSTSSPTATVEPSAITNMIALAADAGDANLQLMRNDGTGTATKIDTGFSKTAVDTFYEFWMWAPPGAGSWLKMGMRRLSDGLHFDTDAVYTTDLPAVDTMLCQHFWLTNGSTVASHSLDFQHFYVDQDN